MILMFAFYFIFHFLMRILFAENVVLAELLILETYHGNLTEM